MSISMIRMHGKSHVIIWDMPKSKGKILKCLKVAIVDTVASDQSCIGKLFQIVCAMKLNAWHEMLV